ncbi:hypothetical protein F2P81_013389 [Scophthalmus maximus]|uniref:T-box transcription factor 2/3 repressor domain-containing protein n=1 Tax=Scophthalmus maximus TaxID=52904 RepID=A0A6A4SGQ9_SCOMX|nr:hypothetical protein F2P81_013389 [Scophthalmus maximus]
MRLMDTNPESRHSDNPTSPGARDTDSTSTCVISHLGRTLQTPETLAQRETDRRRILVLGGTADGASGSEPRDPEKGQTCKLRSRFAHSCVYPPELNAHLWDPRIPGGLFRSTQVNAWNSCGTADGAAPCGLSPAAPVRTPAAAAGFPLSLQQHALVQELVSLSHFGGLLFYPYASLSLRSKVDFRACPSVHSRDYFNSPIMSSSVPAAIVPDPLTLPTSGQRNSVDEAETG